MPSPLPRNPRTRQAGSNVARHGRVHWNNFDITLANTTVLLEFSSSAHSRIVSPTTNGASRVCRRYLRFARNSGEIESTPVGRKDCDLIMQSANLNTCSRSTAEIHVEQSPFCIGTEPGNGRYRDLPPRIPARAKQCPNGCAAAAVFTTFYNHLRWLDNSSREVFIVLPA